MRSIYNYLFGQTNQVRPQPNPNIPPQFNENDANYQTYMNNLALFASPHRRHLMNQVIPQPQPGDDRLYRRLEDLPQPDNENNLNLSRVQPFEGVPANIREVQATFYPEASASNSVNYRFMTDNELSNIAQNSR